MFAVLDLEPGLEAVPSGGVEDPLALVGVEIFVHVTVGYRWLPLATVGYRDEPNGQQGSRHCDWSPVVVSIGDVW